MASPIHHVEATYDQDRSAAVTIGLIVLSTDVISECELAKMIPQGEVAISSTRIKTHNPMTVDHLRAHAHEIAQAAALFDPEGVVQVFVYACTSGSAVISQSVLEKKLLLSAPAAKLTSPMTGALEAFKTLGVQNLAMLSPYPDDVSHAMVSCIENHGCKVVSNGSFHLDRDYDVIRISPESIVSAACSLDVPKADCVFIPCTGFRTTSIISKLEVRLKKPVVTAHQAMLWHALRLGGYKRPIEGFGRLMTV